MAEYQTNELGLPIGQKGEVLPSELSNDYFQALDAALARQEKVQMERTLGDLGDRGFLRSGDTFTRVAQDVLGPSQERRAQIMLPEIQRAAGLGREERLGEVAYSRQNEQAKQQHLYRLEELSQQAEAQRMLAQLEADLSDPGGFDWSVIGGQALGMAAGGLFGGIGVEAGRRIASSSSRSNSGASTTYGPSSTSYGSPRPPSSIYG